MFLKKLKSLISSKLAVLLPIAPLSVGIISCAYGEPMHCCTEYVPEIDDEIAEEIAFFNNYSQMCYTSTSYSGCRFKDIDRSIYEAIKCCAPLKENMHGIINPDAADFVQGERGGMILPASAKSLFLPTVQEGGEHGAFYVKIPANAYTWCLYNANPQTHECNVDRAQVFGEIIDDCCGKADGQNNEKRDNCILSMAMNDGKCPDSVGSCCENLPEQEDDIHVSKADCEKNLQTSNECIETKEDACCRLAPDNSSTNGITKTICKEIYESSGGKDCINSDEKYTDYKNSN
ncbi:MAG: hypothetical protein J6A01_03295 [Proteobacteria bacterium]|nr:hypothetical protein [Pseudomonadota bacterium]